MTRLPLPIDTHLIDAAIAGRLRMTELDNVDRQYVVDRLTARGESAEGIASRLHCSQRLVQRIRSGHHQ